MKKWKTQLILTDASCLLVAIFAFLMHQHIVATSASPGNLETKDDALASLCGTILGGGPTLIWAVPFFQKFKKS